jgi:Mg2+ and Co2+ transporter CorA
LAADATLSDVLVADFAERDPRFRAASIDEGRQLLQDESRLAWVDFVGKAGNAEATLSQLLRDWSETEGIKPELAARREEDPTRRPPKAKRFHRCIFARTYRLEVRYPPPDEELVAEEIHLIVGTTFAITIRYPRLGWRIGQMATEAQNMPYVCDGEGVSSTALMDAVVDFRKRVPPGDTHSVFGLEVATVILDNMTDSTFEAVDGLRASVESVEESVLRKEEWLWHRKKWPQLDRRILGLRRMLRKARWMFMPSDEISEFLTGPFLDVEKADAGIKAQFEDLEREASRAAEAAKDVANHVDSAMALRDSIREDRLNNTMYVLTAVTTVLLVPTLIVGFYGMNFENLPGFGTRNGYWWALGVMILLAGAMWFGIHRYLRRKEAPSERNGPRG